MIRRVLQSLCFICTYHALTRDLRPYDVHVPSLLVLESAHESSEHPKSAPCSTESRMVQKHPDSERKCNGVPRLVVLTFRNTFRSAHMGLDLPVFARGTRSVCSDLLRARARGPSGRVPPDDSCPGRSVLLLTRIGKKSFYLGSDGEYGLNMNSYHDTYTLFSVIHLFRFRAFMHQEWPTIAMGL